MFDNLVCAVREFLGIPQMQERITNSIGSLRGLVDAALRRQENLAVLACVTVLGETTYSDRIFSTALGGEAFVSPGNGVDIKIDPQKQVGRMTYFVSGHPNLVITSFRVGQEEASADCAGKKFGQFSGVVEPGQYLKCRVEYRK